MSLTRSNLSLRSLRLPLSVWSSELNLTSPTTALTQHFIWTYVHILIVCQSDKEAIADTLKGQRAPLLKSKGSKRH